MKYFSQQWRLPKNIVQLSYFLPMSSSSILAAPGSHLSFSLPPAGSSFSYTSVPLFTFSINTITIIGLFKEMSDTGDGEILHWQNLARAKVTE